jgi:hypothetical protein
VSQYWIPLALSSEERADRQARRFGVIARLKPGVSVTQATAELETIAGRLEKQFPTTNARFSARAELLRENISGELTGRYMRMMLGATLFVLLIACANIANLQFARISLRAREIAVRSALGAGRFRVVRLLLVESVVVALCGGGLGICMALWGMALTRKYMSPEVQRYLPGWDRISLDQNALLFTLALAAAAGIVSGIVPAFLGSASTPGEALKEGGRSSTGGRGRARLRGALVVAEIAVSLTLLVGAGLLIKGVSQVDAPRPGMQPARVLTFRLFLPESRYSGGAGVGDFHRRALDAVSALPGVKSRGAGE